MALKDLTKLNDWQTLIDVMRVDWEKRKAYVQISGWDPHQEVEVDLEIFPDLKQEEVLPIFYIALINMRAQRGDELNIRVKERAPEPISEEKLFENSPYIIHRGPKR